MELDATLHVLIGASDSEEGRLGPFRVPVRDRFEILVAEGAGFP